MARMNEPLPPSLLHERSEFYLTLARSFLTPLAEEHYRAMVDFLADDLADLDRSLGYGFTSEVASLRSAMAKVASHEELLVGYSSLFLQPPRAVALNVCAPLDGAVMGGTVSEIELFYRHYGVERSGHFKDLPDHLSVQLEFVSYLYGRAANSLEGEHPDLESEKAAGHFLHAFVSRWLPYFAAGIERAGNKLALQANPYGPLARILAIATARDAAANADWIKPRKRSEVAMDKARLRYAGREISPEDMADMERKLRGKGLGTGHLHVALADRNAAMGLSAKSPPDPRRR